MITEKLMAAGGWSLRLKESTPQSVLDEIDIVDRAFSLIAVTPARLDPTNLGAYTPSSVRSAARYVGVYRARPDKFTIEGAGLAVLLGDEDGKGPVLVDGYSYDAGTLSDWVGDLMTGDPNGIAEGTVTNTGYTQTGAYRYVTVRQALDAVTTACRAEWRINNTLTLDAASTSTLFVTSPVVMAMRGGEGTDPEIIGIQAVELAPVVDAEDYITSAIVIANGDGSGAVEQSTLLAGPYFYYAPDGTAMDITQVFDSGNITADDANTTAATLQAQGSVIRRAVTLIADTPDIKGKIAVGDYMYVYDPLTEGLFEPSAYVRFRGLDTFPITSRVYGYEWPVLSGMGVYLLTSQSTSRVVDLTDWIEFEEGTTRIELSGRDRVLGVSTYQGSVSSGVALTNDPRQITSASASIAFYPNGGASVGNGSTMRPGTTSGSYTELWRGDFYATGVNIAYDITIYPNGSTMDWRLMVYETGGTPTSAAGETGQTSNAQKTGTVAIPTAGLVSGTDPKGKSMTARLEARRTSGSTSVDIAINAAAVNN